MVTLTEHQQLLIMLFKACKDISISKTLLNVYTIYTVEFIGEKKKCYTLSKFSENTYLEFQLHTE